MINFKLSTDAERGKRIYLEVKELLLLNMQQTIVKR